MTCPKQAGFITQGVERRRSVTTERALTRCFAGRNLLHWSIHAHSGTRTPPEGLPCGAATSLTLGAYMGKGYMRSRKTFPQGVFLGISLILSAGYTSTLL